MLVWSTFFIPVIPICQFERSKNFLPHPCHKGTKDNSENSTYLGSDFEDDEHHTVKRKEFYQVCFNINN